MLDLLKSELNKYGIDLFGAVPLDRCRITRPHKLWNGAMVDLEKLSAVMIAIPYYTKGAENENRNISAYAVSRDYHLFCKQLFNDLVPMLSRKFEGYRFCGYADDSPIFERDAAAMAGLGIIGDNMMLITEKYSSFVFLAEIITDYPIKHRSSFEVKHCEGCGRCISACPMSRIGGCLSALTQKKGELSNEEREAILEYGSVWGCDICSEVCPHTTAAINNGTIFSPIPFFNTERIPHLTSAIIHSMSDEEFESRAYSWRKRPTILRNLLLLEDSNKKN